MARTFSAYARTYVRARAEAHMGSNISIYRHEDPAFDPSTGIITSQHGTRIYLGPARIWTAQGGNVMVLGDADLNMMDTYVSIPFLARPVPHRDDVIIVLRCDMDPDLNNRAFRVMSVDGGGLLSATRKMLVSTFAESHTWEPTL